VALAAAAAGARKDVAADTPPAAPTTETGKALEALRSPFFEVREEAVDRLTALGAAARGPVLAAFSEGSVAEREALARVLAADGSPEALNLLLSTFLEADAATARAIQRALIDHVERLGDAVAAWGEARGASPRIRGLASILRRAHIEKAFLSRKSRSGGTGYYRGQFDVLKPHRREALNVCLKILADRAYKLPGEYPAGGYRFLRAPPFFVDASDLRLMAANAVAELASQEDVAALDELEGLHAYFAARDDEDGLFGGVDGALRDAVLSILCRLRPDAPAGDTGRRTWRTETELRIRRLQSSVFVDSAAALLLRLGRYEEAIAVYTDSHGDGSAVNYYNVACAYASWSLDEKDPKRRVYQLEMAMASLERAAANGFLDWPWMEQDKDLDPIRSNRRYAKVLEKIREQFVPPTEAPPGRDPGTSAPGESAMGEAPESPPAMQR
jgi:hypothetical protein